MKGLLLDENLPGQSPTGKLPSIHVRELGAGMSDAEVWAYASVHDLVIVSKDADFANRMMISTPPPRVVHLRIGNMRLANFMAFLERVWPTVETLVRDHKLVNVYTTRFEAVA
jgi:predicted nuclease of predicted toxin-antitoxin system